MEYILTIDMGTLVLNTESSQYKENYKQREVLMYQIALRGWLRK